MLMFIFQTELHLILYSLANIREFALFFISL